MAERFEREVVEAPSDLEEGVEFEAPDASDDIIVVLVDEASGIQFNVDTGQVLITHTDELEAQGDDPLDINATKKLAEDPEASARLKAAAEAIADADFELGQEFADHTAELGAAASTVRPEVELARRSAEAPTEGGDYQVADAPNQCSLVPRVPSLQPDGRTVRGWASYSCSRTADWNLAVCHWDKPASRNWWSNMGCNRKIRTGSWGNLAHSYACPSRSTTSDSRTRANLARNSIWGVPVLHAEGGVLRYYCN